MRRFITSLVCSVLFLVILPGCASNTLLTKLNPLNLFMGHSAKKEAKTAVKQAGIEDKAVKAAQVEVVKTGVLLSAAQVENPQSVPVAAAVRTNANAADLLNQREPLDAATKADAVAIAQGLAIRAEKAEKAQAEVESTNRRMALDLEAVRVELKALKAKADTEASNSLAMAKELNNERLMKYGGMGLSLALGLLSIAYKLNIGRLQTGAGEVLAKLQQAHGDAVAGTARNALDAVLHTGEQKGVFKAFATISSK